MPPCSGRRQLGAEARWSEAYALGGSNPVKNPSVSTPRPLWWWILPLPASPDVLCTAFTNTLYPYSLARRALELVHWGSAEP